MVNASEYWKDPVRKQAALERSAHTRFLNKQSENRQRNDRHVEIDDLSKQVVALIQQKNELENKIKQMLNQHSLKTGYGCIDDITLHSEAQIVAASEPVKVLCGVYFLIRTERVVYVGQSVNVHARMSGHILEGSKTFDRIAFIECHPEQLDVWETLYIHIFKPELNGKGNTECGKATPMSIKEIVAQIKTNKQDELHRRHIRITDQFYLEQK